MTMLPHRLKEKRTEKGWTQVEAAKSIGVARTTYAMYEQGKREPDNETLGKLADVFNVSSDYLLGREVPVWATNKDVTDLERVLKLNDTLEYRGEKISNEDREKLLRVIEAIFWEQREENRDQP